MKTMPWFKWWDGTAADPKLRMLAESVATPVAIVLGIWAYLHEKASTAPERGVIPADLDVPLMAYTLQVEPFVIETVRNAMKRFGSVTETGHIVKWDERQAKRENGEPPGASTKRVRALRERKKANENKDVPPASAAVTGETGETAETVGNGTKQPKKKKEIEEEKKPKPSSSAGADGVPPFEQFWSAYPWNAAKQDAHKAWIKVEKNWRKLNKQAPDADMLATLLAAIAAQKEGYDWKHADGQYIPRASTWLNGGRWLDVVRPWTPPPLKLPPGWWESHEGMKAAGAMLTPPLTPNKGEFPKDFAARIRVALGQLDAPATGAPALPYVPPAPPADVILTDEQRESRRDEFRETVSKTAEQRAAEREEFRETVGKLRQAAGMPPKAAPPTTN